MSAEVRMIDEEHSMTAEEKRKREAKKRSKRAIAVFFLFLFRLRLLAKGLLFLKTSLPLSF